MGKSINLKILNEKWIFRTLSLRGELEQKLQTSVGIAADTSVANGNH